MNDLTELHKAMMSAGWYADTRWVNGRWRDVYVTERPLWIDGIVPDRSAEPHYVIGRGGNTYPAEFVEMHPYSYGRH